MNPERSRNQINGIVSEALAAITPKPPTSAQEQTLLRAKEVSQKVLHAFHGQKSLMPIPPTKEQAFDMIWPLYREGFKTWSTDDLLYICSLAHASIGVEQITDELL